MTKGRVIKNYNGYYYVDVGRDNLVECRRRGKLLKAKILVGDELEITELENEPRSIDGHHGSPVTGSEPLSHRQDAHDL